MGRIADAEQKVKDLEAELARLRAEWHRLSQDLIKANDDPENPESQGKAAAIEKARRNLDGKIALLLSDQGPLRKAKNDLAELRHQRDNLASLIETIESRAAPYPLESIEQATGELTAIFNKTGQPPEQAGHFEHWSRGMWLWSKHMREDLKSLPARRRRLAEY